MTRVSYIPISMNIIIYSKSLYCLIYNYPPFLNQFSFKFFKKSPNKAEFHLRSNECIMNKNIYKWSINGVQ